MVPLIVALLFAVDSPKSPLATCLGPFCVDGPAITAHELQQTYGNAPVRKGMLCYQDGELYVRFRLDPHEGSDPVMKGIYVGERPPAPCEEPAKAAKPFPKLMTPSGIAIGDPLGKVQVLYGDRPQFGVETFDGGSQRVSWDVCGCETTTIDVRLEQGRIVSIEVGESE